MASRVSEAFKDADFISLVRTRLPHLFQIAELESMRSGKIGMEVGTLRERIIIALLIHYFGRNQISTGPITESETDVRVTGRPISIKTITGKDFGGVKAVWTVDAEVAHHFAENYEPSCDMLLVRIQWYETGGLYFIPMEVQRFILGKIGRERFFKLPPPGTNPRGVEYTKESLQNMALHSESVSFTVHWNKTERLEYDIYKRWINAWKTPLVESDVKPLQPGLGLE